ncbi:E3 ubiquitin-protein ligase ATL31, partial [Bienertia sinuspersici]
NSTAPGLEPNPSTDADRRPPREVIVVAILSALLFVAFYFIYLCCCIDDHFVQIGNWSGWRHPWGTFAASLRRHSSKSTQNELDPEVVKSFPTFEYGAIKSSMIGKGTLECAVCLTEYNDKDVLRLIPKCDHVFHADCVDDWLVGHGTCPVCRLNLANVEFQDDHDQNYVVMMEEDNNNPIFRLFGRLSRSLSTGHVAVKQWKDMERYTLRLPWEVRRQIMSRSSERFGNDKDYRRGKSTDSWVFSLTPSFRKELNMFEGISGASTSTSSNTSTRKEESPIDFVSVDETTQLPV